MRVFVALELPESTCDRLEALQSLIPVGRRTPRPNLHLTLEFLGEQSADAVECAHIALSDIAARSFELQIMGTGAFGRRSPQIVFAGVADSPPLVQLQKQVRNALHAAGLQFDRQRFRPHVTIARFNRAPVPGDLSRLRDALESSAGFAAPPFQVTSFALFQSTLGHGPARHEVLAHYDLM